MAGLDLGKVQNVIDQRQKIVARRFNRAGEFHLFVRQIAVRIVGQKLGQDQQRVERGAQFVAHIGQKIGFVLARLFQFTRLQLKRGGSATQFVALALKRLGLLFELAVGLLKLDLLQFEARLRFLERIALFLELLVGDPQFLALGLKLAGLPLRFLQCVLQTLTEPRRSQGDAHRARDRFKQFEHALVDSFKEAELHDGIHAPIGKGRRHDHMPRCFAAERRSDLQVPFGQVGQRRRSRIRRDLSKQPFARPERFGHSGLIRHAKHGNSIEGAAFALEECTGDRVRAIGEECQNGCR